MRLDVILKTTPALEEPPRGNAVEVSVVGLNKAGVCLRAVGAGQIMQHGNKPS